MDDYLRNFLFAADLLEYLFLQCHIPWEMPIATVLKDCLQSKFDVEIGLAVRTIWKRNYHDIEACYMELRKEARKYKDVDEVEDDEENVRNKKALRFSKYAISAAHSYFSKGYDSGSFLGYCAIVLGVATYYFGYPSTQIPEIAVEVVALVLLAHQLTGQFYKDDGWNGLQETSLKFNCLPINLE